MLWSDGSGEVTSSSWLSYEWLARFRSVSLARLYLHRHYLFTSEVFRHRKTTQTQDLNSHRHIHIYNVLHDATIAHEIVFIIPAQQFNQIISIITLVVVGVALC